jgi:integral membrane protein (TIGR01906 family)
MKDNLSNTISAVFRIAFILSFICVTIYLPFIVVGYNISIYENIVSEDTSKDASEVYDFLKNKNQLDFLNEQEIFHMEEVKKVIDNFDSLFYVAMLFVIISLAFTKNKHEITNLLMYGSIASLISILIIVLMISFSFDNTFNNFHKPLFTEDTYTFPHNSTIKTIFPDYFFEEISKAILISSIFFNLILLLSAFAATRLKKFKTFLIFGPLQKQKLFRKV